MDMPKNLGLKMPAEWEKHSAVWMAWPHDPTTFTQGVDKAEATFCEIIHGFSGSEPVNLIVLPEAQTRVAEMLKNFGCDLANINFYPVTYADVWTRDYGPIFLNQNAFVKWDYNVYGKGNDDPVYWAPLLKDHETFNLINLPGQKFTPGIVMEGGSLEVNGQGTLITTEQCLLNKNRNPHLSKEKIEEYLQNYLGVSKIIWLKNGLFNDHTDGHIDDIVKFVGPNKIVCAFENDPTDENYKTLSENFEALKNSTDQDGKPFELIKMPLPHMRYEAGHTVHSDDPANTTSEAQGEKAAVSYINAYIGNTVVLVPTFSDPNDAEALKIYQDCFPDKKVIGINCMNIIYGGGTIHCMTQQQPL